MKEPTLDTKHFKSKLSLGFFDRNKNPLLLDITKHLNKIENLPKNHYAGRAEEAHQLFLACQIWLDKKSSKTKPSRRKPFIEQLRDLAIDYFVFNQYTNTRGQKTGSQNVAAKYQTKGLLPQFEAERASGKGADHKYNPTVAGYKIGNAYKGRSDQEIKQRIQLLLNDPKTVALKYYNKEERLRTMLLFIKVQGNRVQAHVKSPNGHGLELFDTSAGKNSEFTWVCDEYGNFYAGPEPQMKGSFHHSTLLHGKSCVCAGMIMAKGGSIKYMDNLSGHYRPDSDALVLAMEVLSEVHGMMPVQVGTVSHVERDEKGVATIMDMHFNANTFLICKGTVEPDRSVRVYH